MVGISYTSTGGRKKRERIVQKEGRMELNSMWAFFLGLEDISISS